MNNECSRQTSALKSGEIRSIPRGFGVFHGNQSVRTPGLISWREGKMQEAEQLDESLRLTYIYFSPLSFNLLGWVGLIETYRSIKPPLIPNQQWQEDACCGCGCFLPSHSL